jgi:Tfp pilus assembly protein PilF
MLSFPACTHSKPKPLVPLELAYGANAQAVTLNSQGTQAFQAGQMAEAKDYFGQAIKAAPDSGQAHYNYALALNALGETETARQQFIEAANLAPGDKVIWDSPALRPFGSPQAQKGPPREHPYGTQRPMIGSGPR